MFVPDARLLSHRFRNAVTMLASGRASFLIQKLPVLGALRLLLLTITGIAVGPFKASVEKAPTRFAKT